MKHIVCIILIILIKNTYNAQCRLIFNNNSYLVIRNSAYLVISNANANAITTLGTGGNIISEGEFNRVKWNIRTNTGTYRLPFTKSAGNKIPLSVTINTAGIGASGHILFSTYGGSTWDNSTYLPTGVTNIGSLTGGVNNSAKVIDRFWIIDAQGYTTKPSPRINFTYLDAEWSAAGNSIAESTLFAQRFSSTLNDWGSWLGPYGTANITTNTVTTGNVNASEFFRSWTLVNQGFILPIELLYFNAECEGNTSTIFKWATATEQNNDYFTIEASTDAANWFALEQKKGAGNSVTTEQYSTQVNTYGYEYFRLKQTDFNNTCNYSDIIYKNCDKIEPSIDIFPNPNNGDFKVKITDYKEELITIKITNTLGQIVDKFSLFANSRDNSFDILMNETKAGLYFVTITINNTIITKKIIVNE